MLRNILPITILIIFAATAGAQAPNLAESSNNFGFRLYEELLETEEGNFSFSPLSIFSAMTLAYEGAAGDTATEMQETLELPESREDIHSGFGTLVDSITASGEVTFANGLWYHEDYPVSGDFLISAKENFRSEIAPLNIMDALAAASTVNKWISDNTKGKINNLVSPNDLVGGRIILANALTMEDLWKEEFDEFSEGIWYNLDPIFTTVTGDEIPLEMMEKEINFPYVEDTQRQVIRVSYENNLSMIVILPRAVETESLQNIDSTMVDNWISDMEWKSVYLSLPVFKTSSLYPKMKGTLIQAGIREAFARYFADFSGMYLPGTIWEEQLFISMVAHQSEIEITKYGTKAEAATVAVAAIRGSMMDDSDYIAWDGPIIFHTDHPFLYLIRDDTTGAILFMGRFDVPPESQEN